jgi:hypothetical protein
VPSSDDEEVPSTIPVVPDTDSTSKESTDSADSKDGDDNGVLLLIIGILGGSLVTIIALYCACKNKFGEKDGRDSTDKSRLL